MQIIKTHHEIIVLKDGRRSGVPIMPNDLIAEARAHAEEIAESTGLSIIEFTKSERIADLDQNTSAIIIDVVVMKATDGGPYHRVCEIPRAAPSYPFRETRLPS